MQGYQGRLESKGGFRVVKGCAKNCVLLQQRYVISRVLVLNRNKFWKAGIGVLVCKEVAVRCASG